MQFSIRTKFLLLVSLLLLIIFGTITFFLIRNSTQSLRKDLFEESRAFAGLATQPIGNVFAIYKDSGTSRIDQQVSTFSALNPSITNITIIDISGKAVYHQNTSTTPVVSEQEASSFEPVYRTNPQGALANIIQPYFEASGAHRFSVVYTVSDEEIERAVNSEAVSLLYFGLASLAVTMGLTYLLINRLIIKPVRQVSEQAGVISSGNLEQQIIVHGRDEIASLGESVNHMAESLKANIAELKEIDKVKSEFMMITSHNLRTPLTIITGYLENMDLYTDTDKLQTALKRINASVKRLEIFAEDVLTISRFDLDEIALKTEETPVGGFISHLLKEFAPTAELKELQIKADLPETEKTIHISKPYIRSAIWNILDNAVKFTPKGGSVGLRLILEDNSVKIQISDTGIGIAHDEMPKLFTKFHRGTSTLVYDFEGTGIGLYASKVMVEKHGGTIDVVSKEGEGSTFTITLPTAPPKTPAENTEAKV